MKNIAIKIVCVVRDILLSELVVTAIITGLMCFMVFACVDKVSKTMKNELPYWTYAETPTEEYKISDITKSAY